MSSPAKLRNRRGQHASALSSESDQTDDHGSAMYSTSRRGRSSIDKLLETDKVSWIAVGVLTLLAFITRFYKIKHPDQVVFDEVHFGKFAAFYILREYYFDVHPPFAKMLFGLAGWFVGFDGKFEFENIGDNYTDNHVPYVGMRSLAALFGSLTVPVVYGIMKESGYSTVIAAFSTLIIVFDNAHIAQSRLILLDATLIFLLTCTIYAYIRFRKLRYHEFSAEWWGWLIGTGVLMALTWASKVNGILAVVTIGVAVLIDLWDILDINKEGHTMNYFYRHFIARAIGLIVVPFIVYLSIFYVHFAILTHTGTGDSFMSPAFQETLIGNELLLNSADIHYYDTITMRHRETKVLLHSHVERYPLKYDDGRISTQGQQVTGYAHEDTNNQWQVIPTKAIPETGRGRVVRHGDTIQLLHVNTQSHLLTHDVASPLMPTNQEFTTWPKDDHSRYNDTLFYLNIIDAHEGEPFKSKASHFKLQHMPTKVFLWTHAAQLPDWAFKQQEINGNKKPSDKSAVWYVDDILSGTSEEDEERLAGSGVKEPKSMNFFKKFAELQLLMLQHNAGLTASHPYASAAINWPFLISGISFWTEAETSQQIYLIGNVVGWWTCAIALAMYVGITLADLLARRRNEYPIPDAVRNRLWNTAGFFLLVWGVHYVPFFLMNRQLFIHHYLPSQLFSALIAGAVLNFMTTDSINYPISKQGRKTHLRPRMYADIGGKGPIIVLAYTGALLWMFFYLAPLTYGTPGLDGQQVNSKRLLSSWTLHFAGKETAEV